MTDADSLKSLWLAVDDVALPIAELRDEWLRFPGLRRRWSQLDKVYRDLREVEQIMFELMEAKNTFFGAKSAEEVRRIAEIMISNARVILEICRAELALL